MASNIVLRWKALFLIGAFLTILGSFLPWKCIGGFIWYCPSGLDINLDALALISPSTAVITLVALIAAALIVNAVEVIQQWRIEISAVIIASLLLYLLMDKKVITDNGGSIVIFLCSIALWRFFWIVTSSWRSDLVITASILLLIIVSIYKVITILLMQILDEGTFEGTSLQFGLQIVLIGSLLMLAAQLWEHLFRFRHYSQKHIGNP
jgi:hypothetical protein